MKNIHKALTFRASSIGDSLMGKYLLENVHAQFPLARCGIVVANHGSMIRDLFAAYPWLEVIEANRHSPSGLWSLLRNFHGSDFVVTQYAGKKDGRFAFASKLVARLLAKRSGLIGFTDASKVNGLLYDKLISLSRTEAPAFLEREAINTAGIRIEKKWPTFQYVPVPSVLEKFSLTPKGYIVVHLFAGNKSRGLHSDKKRGLLVALQQKFPNMRLIVSGGKGDREEAEHITEGLSTLVIAGETTLQELSTLIAESRGTISVDTGVAHMTAQIGTPLIVLVGCLGRHWWQDGQYRPGAPISVFSRADLCTSGHQVSEGYSDCLGEIAIVDVVYTATKALI